MGTLEGRTALVTGATSGIGRAIAARLAREGAAVAVAGRDPVRGAAAVEAIRDDGHTAVLVAGDLSAGRDAVRRVAQDAEDALGGRVDILVNNAGVYPPAPTLGADADTVAGILGVNVAAPFFLVQALAPGMIARGGGVILNIGSWISTVGLPAGALYSASKAALEQLTRGWSAEFAGTGLRVAALAPGVTVTEGTADHVPALTAMGDGFPAGRLGTPEDVAAAAAFLAGDAAAYVHGATLVVDGGALATRAA